MIVTENFVYLIFALSVLFSYAIRRRIYLGPIDPLKLVALSEGVWVATICQLWTEGVATDEQTVMFATCLSLWWAAWWIGAQRFGNSYRQAITRFWQRVAAMPGWGKRRLTMLYGAGLFALLLVTLVNGGGGDNRLYIIKLLRPIESLTTVLVPVVLFQLIVAKKRSAHALLVVFMLGMILTGGKASILSLLVPLTGAALVGRIRIRARLVASLVVVGLVGFGASVVINYGIADPLAALQLLYIRISLDGDVYLLALTNDLLSRTDTTSLTAYLLGPLIKLLFLPIDVDTNIGAQIGSLLRGEDTVNGPNPHWPIVLLAYNKSIVTAVVLSLLCFAIVLTLKFRLSRFSQKRRWPLWAVIPINGYVLLYPQTFFADPSFPLIYLLQAGILAMVLAFVLTPLRPTRAARAAVQPA